MKRSSRNGLPPTLATLMITGVALSSDTPVAGSFSSSDSMLNRLLRMEKDRAVLALESGHYRFMVKP